MRCDRRIVALIAVIAAAACQPLPQPFQPSARVKAGNPLLGVADSGGIVVRPVDGVPGDGGAALAREMVAALVGQEVLAFEARGNLTSLVLRGAAEPLRNDNGRILRRITWRIVDRSGRETGRHEVVVATTPVAWQGHDPGLLKDIAARSAPRIAAMVLPAAPVDRLATLPKRELFVLPVTGAPGPAGDLLREQMAAALRDAGFRVGSTRVPASVTVAADLGTTARTGGQTDLRVDWKVRRPDGAELGALSQNNRIATDTLERDWPRLAQEISTAAAAGIRELMDKLRPEDLGTAPAAAEKADGRPRR